MKTTSLLVAGLALAALAAPIAAAQNVTQVNNPPPSNPTVDINVNNPTPQESTTFVGLSGTAVIVLVVLAVIVVALIVALASRDRYP